MSKSERASHTGNRHGGGRPPGGPGGGPPGMMMPGAKAKNFKGTFKRLIQYLKPYQIRLFIVFLTAILSTIFSIVSPRVLGEATDIILDGWLSKEKGIAGAGIDFKGIAFILAILALLYVISAVFGFIQQFLMAKVAQKVVYQLREDVNHKLGRLPLKFFDSRSNGDILSRVVNDVDNVANTLQQSLTQMITSVVTIIGIIIMMLTISPLLTLILILTLPLSFVVIAVVAKKSQRHFKNQQNELGDLNGHVEEMYTGHTIVKAFGREKESIQRFEEMNDKLYESSWRAQFMSGIMMPLMGFIGNIGYVLICVVGGIQVTNQVITVGNIQAFIQYARQFTMPITQTANIANIIQSTIASAERVFELLDEVEEEKDINPNLKIANPQGNVSFQHVKFGYKDDAVLMEDLNLDVKSGQTIAIVGPTGAGKTTLVNLLMRFYNIQGGAITIDGKSIDQLERSYVRSLFGMVLQDTWLFNGTIRDNIAYGRDGASEEEIIAAAKAAHADHFIRTLPDGYNTILNEEASNISSGQKQLLTIARAILADPSMLILDEATSSVDTRTELHIQQAMNNLMEGRTSFVIAHRLSTIKDADLILVMNQGSVIEQGSHDQLLASGGFYSELYASQFANGGSAEVEDVHL
ncbi:MAG: ABC transporter ATP-binding protein/permease [Candidatus Pristimantibacillus lignocellulolyticus]|uniref:ABC transporter ATP-binding protein/permease n=1 Tax=Candidatus Pristimantibacillus lignocellulolyticus TaxID=2994561 RepID=A0A9J6ZL69_9BACL|nr:MAG: ABC transporter ATP-binding protein/permease [Candidatus Pristimantibacillus lignocellulolyticus]